MHGHHDDEATIKYGGWLAQAAAALQRAGEWGVALAVGHGSVG
jgi:hypothetical protein